MGIEFLISLLKASAEQLPDLLMPLIGIALSIYYPKRSPKKYRLASIAFIIFLLITLKNILFIVWNDQGGNSINDSQLGVLVASCSTGMIAPVAWILLLVSIYHPKYAGDDDLISLKKAELPAQKSSSVMPVLGYICLSLASMVVSLVAGFFTFGWTIPKSSTSPGSGIGMIVVYATGVPIILMITILAPIAAQWIFKGSSGRWKRIAFSFLIPILSTMAITAIISWCLGYF
jgi:hypothetical protein